MRRIVVIITVLVALASFGDAFVAGPNNRLPTTELGGDGKIAKDGSMKNAQIESSLDEWEDEEQMGFTGPMAEQNGANIENEFESNEMHKSENDPAKESNNNADYASESEDQMNENDSQSTEYSLKETEDVSEGDLKSFLRKPWGRKKGKKNKRKKNKGKKKPGHPEDNSAPSQNKPHTKHPDPVTKDPMPGKKPDESEHEHTKVTEEHHKMTTKNPIMTTEHAEKVTKHTDTPTKHSEGTTAHQEETTITKHPEKITQNSDATTEYPEETTDEHGMMTNDPDESEKKTGFTIPNIICPMRPCPMDLECINFQCKRICESDDYCPGGYMCLDGVCQLRPKDSTTVDPAEAVDPAGAEEGEEGAESEGGEAEVTIGVETQETKGNETQETECKEAEVTIGVETQETKGNETQETECKEAEVTIGVETQETKSNETQETEGKENEITIGVETQETKGNETQETKEAAVIQQSAIESAATLNERANFLESPNFFCNKSCKPPAVCVKGHCRKVTTTFLEANEKASNSASSQPNIWVPKRKCGVIKKCPPGQYCMHHWCMPIKSANSEGQNLELVSADYQDQDRQDLKSQYDNTLAPILIKCGSNKDCPRGQACRHHWCMKVEPVNNKGQNLQEFSVIKCNSNKNCPIGQICRQHRCVRIHTEYIQGQDFANLDDVLLAPIIIRCGSKGECPRGYICRHNILCVRWPGNIADDNGGQTPPFGRPCVRDTDCPRRQICRQGLCIFGSPNIRCRRHSDCPTDMRCIFGRCLRLMLAENNQNPLLLSAEKNLDQVPALDIYCTWNQYCPTGYICLGHRCFELHSANSQGQNLQLLTADEQSKDLQHLYQFREIRCNSRRPMCPPMTYCDKMQRKCLPINHIDNMEKECGIHKPCRQGFKCKFGWCALANEFLLWSSDEKDEDETTGRNHVVQPQMYVETDFSSAADLRPTLGGTGCKIFKICPPLTMCENDNCLPIYPLCHILGCPQGYNCKGGNCEMICDPEEEECD